MALYRWICPECGRVVRKLASTRPTDPVICPEDGVAMGSDLDVSSLVKECLDNGVMPRVVEQIKDVSEMVKERSKTKEDPTLV